MTRPSSSAVLPAAFVLLATLAGIVVTVPARAAQGAASCTGFIDSVPVVIQTSGTWCLRKDLNTAQATGRAIDIRASNVVLDCNHFKLGGLAAGTGTETVGIYSQNLHNVTVRRCNVRGFVIGLDFWGMYASGHLVEDNRFEGNTRVGIKVGGEGGIVRRNRVLDTGGSTSSETGGAVGIALVGSVDAIDNGIGNVFARLGSGSSAHGINSTENRDVSISGNRIRGVIADGAGEAYAIHHGLWRAVLRDNDLSGTGVGVGMFCSTGHARAKGNLINGFATPLAGGCADDGNFSKP